MVANGQQVTNMEVIAVGLTILAAVGSDKQIGHVGIDPRPSPSNG